MTFFFSLQKLFFVLKFGSGFVFNLLCGCEMWDVVLREEEGAEEGNWA